MAANRRDVAPRWEKTSAARASEGWAEIAAVDFNLLQTLECGQVFHWQREGAGYVGAIANEPVYVEQRGERLLLPAGREAAVARYMALDHPLPEIYASFPDDEDMQRALEFCRGLRILRQPDWECLATFITSSMKQVAHIAQMSQAIRSRFGERLEWPGRLLYAYPTPERVAALSEDDLRACGLGYRAKNLLGTARRIASGEVDLQAIARMSFADARETLCGLPGVGEKVANCALLFGFERVEAFPIDVWIERVLREIYFRGKRRVTAKRLRDFSQTYFGAYGGYAQQYLFHYARKNWRAAEKPVRRKARPQEKSV